MNQQNYYDILQISPKATIKEIKAAFRRLARQSHPDLNPDKPTAAETFKKICQAYEVLSDPQQRQQYDRQLPSYSSEMPSVNLTAQEFYQQGLEKAKERDYRRAITNYTQAIQINPQFWQAYLKRSESYYQIGKDRSVLEDCHRILQINPNYSLAYYYLGLSRQRLGYIQSAIKAYIQAIQIDSEYAQAYYQKGLAHEEIKEYIQANKDLQVASELFRKAGNVRQYQLVQQKRNQLSKHHLLARKREILSILRDLPVIFIYILKSLWIITIHPKNGLISIFLQLEKKQALMVGVLSGIVTAVCLSYSWQNWSVGFSFLHLTFLGFVPFLILSLLSYSIRSSWRVYGYLAGDIFLGGLTLLPLSLWLLILSRFINSESVLVILKFIAIFYTGWILYNGYIQISNFPPKLSLGMSALTLTFITFILCGIYYIRFFS